MRISIINLQQLYNEKTLMKDHFKYQKSIFPIKNPSLEIFCIEKRQGF